jgi:vacuolar-type H+-ATPase subunit E/Vma4
MEQNQKLSKFLSAMQKEAEKRRDLISRDTEKFKKNEIKKIKHEALKEAGVIIRDKEQELKTNLAKKVTAEKLQNRNKIILKREELTEELFNEVKDKLIDFTKTPDYIEKVKRDVESVKDSLTGKITVKSKADDKAVSEIKSLFPQGTNFETDSNIKLGAIIIVLEDKKQILDFTFDADLESQKEKFREESNLKISK